MDSRPDIEQLKDAVDLVHVVSQRVQLERKGRHYVGLCPFHEERTPSFNVSPEHRAAKCWGCGWKGDAFDFLAATQGRELRDVLKEHLRDHGGVAPPQRRHAPARPAGNTFPPREEVAQLWADAMPLGSEPAAVDYVRSRPEALNVDQLDDLHLPAVLPHNAVLPAWASIGGVPWNRHPAAFRLVTPMWGGLGDLVTVHVRPLHRGSAGPKALPPGRGMGRVRGAVFADLVARHMLAGTSIGGVPYAEWTAALDVVVVEGEPHFWWQASRNGAGWGPAVGTVLGAPPRWMATVGVINGSWTKDLAARIPSTAVVHLATHDDEAGNRYAAEIAATLPAHDCRRQGVRNA